jgi:photosynthetic reaction center cytochrome c subunit
MTREINVNWTSHVGQTGVSCYTCHRGNPIPQGTWFEGGGVPVQNAGAVGWRNGQNTPGPLVGFASLPSDPFTPLLKMAEQIRVTPTTALPSKVGEPIQTAERTHALMMQFSNGLGVNCTYCHNSRSFGSWESSPPTRVTAWHGIQMSRKLNTEYLAPLSAVYPAEKLGPEGDAAKVMCQTCHQGVNKPLYGAPMLSDYPELGAPRPPQ